MAVSLNKTATVAAAHFTATLTQAFSSTVPAGDIIVVCVDAETNTSQGAFTVSSVTASGLTFTRRASKYDTGGGPSPGTQGSETWWAVVPAGGFAPSTVTITFSRTIDDANSHMFSVSGADTINPFGAGTAAVTASATGTAAAVNAVVTIDAGAFVFVTAGSSSGSSGFYATPASGFTNIDTATNSSASNFQYSGVDYIIASAYGGLTAGWGSTTYTHWTLIADAINPAGPAYVSGDTAIDSGASGTVTVTAPTSIASGNVLIATGDEEQVTSRLSWSMPSGWTKIVTETATSSFFVAFKVATGSEPANYGFGWSGGTSSSRPRVTIVQYTGNVASPIDTEAAAYSGNNVTVVSLPTATAAGGKETLVGIWGAQPSGATAFPSGMTQRRADFSGGTYIAVFDSKIGAAGSVGGQSITWITGQFGVPTAVVLLQESLSGRGSDSAPATDSASRSSAARLRSGGDSAPSIDGIPTLLSGSASDSAPATDSAGGGVVATAVFNIAGSGETSTGTTDVQVSFTTVPAGDVIVVAVNAETVSGPWSVVSVTATGLTFHQRGSKHDTGFGGGEQGTELWWAIVPHGGFSGQVTANFDVTIDDANMHGFSVSNVDGSAPFSGSPAYASNPTNTPVFVSAFLPSAAAGSLTIAAAGMSESGSFDTPYPNPAMTIQESINNNGGFNVEYSAIETGQAVGTVGFDDNNSFWTLIVDAINPVPPGELTGVESFHTHGGSAAFVEKIATRVDLAWQSNAHERSATATIDVGDTTDDGFDFDDPPDDDDIVIDAGLMALSVQEQAADLRSGLDATVGEPKAHSIRRQYFDITSGPTIDANGQPDPTSWVFTRHRRTWGHYRVRVGTKNVTVFRGAHTIIQQLSTTEPFGDDTVQLYFPAIGSFEPHGTGDLYWLPSVDDDAHIPIVIKHVHPDGTVAIHFEGEISAMTDTVSTPQAGTSNRTGMTLNGTGIIKCFDERITKPRFNSDPLDIGRLIHRWTKYECKYGFHGHPCPAAATGILTAERGGYGDPLMTTSIQNLLATAQTGQSGPQWTIVNHRPRGMRLVQKDLTTVDATLWCGQPGVTHNLVRDLTTAYRAIFGEGQDHDTQFWRNAKYPNAYISVPAFSHTFTPGDSTMGFRPFSEELTSRGYDLDSDQTYLASDETTIKEFQDDMGVTVDGTVGAQTWTAAFEDGQNSDALYAYIAPLAVGEHAEPFLYNGRGGIIGRNPNFDHRSRREKLEQFGTMSKANARTSAKREIQIVHHADYAGTITMTNVDPPEMCALSLRAGMNVEFKGHHGFDRIMHIAKVDINPGMDPEQSDRVVTLTLNERGDDYVTLAARLQRNRDVMDLSGRVKASHRTSRRTPDFTPYDSESGAGFLKPRAQQAGRWGVYAIPAGEIGTIVHVRLVADVDTEIAAAIFNKRITPRHLVKLPGLADPSKGSTDPWAKNAKILTRNLKYRNQPWVAWATGGPGAMQGYWPHQPTGAAGDRTGVLDDGASWNFHSARPPWLWLAIWTKDACNISGDPQYKHRALFPGPPQ